jgi:hypothetical protein
MKPQRKITWINVWAVDWPDLSTVLVTQKKIEVTHGPAIQYFFAIGVFLVTLMWMFITPESEILLLYIYMQTECATMGNVVKYKAVSCSTKALNFSLSLLHLLSFCITVILYEKKQTS